MLLVPDIHTQHLILVAITPSLLRLEPSDLSRLLATDVPEIWPPEHWEAHVLDFIDKQCRETPSTIGWNRYVVLRSQRPVLVGTLGGFPRSATDVEIGYSILPPWQRRGIATEGVKALVTEIFRDARVNVISAQTFPHLVASVRVLEKCGFKHVGCGDDEGTIRYRLEPNRMLRQPGSSSRSPETQVDGP